MKSEELSEYYKAADLFVLPTREDIWGLVINEAMNYGLPVITTTACVAGQELVQQEENGYLVDGEDLHIISELNCYIKKIIFSEGIRKQLSNASLRAIKKYSIEDMACSYYEHLREDS